MAIGTIPVLLGTGDHASRPAANAVGIGGIYSCTDHDLIYQTDGASWTTWATLGTTGAAPDTADYLVGTANGSLSGEIVVGATPGGELGNTWASPTVDATHSGSAHADFIAKAIVDVKGDIIVATAADTVVRLAAGTNGDVLTANSAATEGVEWAAPASGGGVTVEDEGTPLSTTATTLDFVGAGVTATGSGATKTITIPGGTGDEALLLDNPPGSPSVYDDEGSGSLPGIWTDPLTSAAGQTNTITRANGWTLIQPATAGTASTGKAVFGIRQTCPAGSFSVSAKVFDLLSEDISQTDDARTGLFVATTGGKAHVIGHQSSVNRAGDYMGITTYSESADWSTYDGTETFIAPALTTPGTSQTSYWYKFEWDAGTTTLTYYYSFNGVRWNKVGSRNTGVAQPDRIGVCMYANAADIRADHMFGYRWFRVV